jgi:hypothetical protein
MSTAHDEFNALMRDKERRTAHPEDDDDDDARSFLNLSDDEEDDDTTPAASHIDPDDIDIAPQASSSLNRSTIPLTRYEANTGPKGVISDAQNFRDSRRSRRISLQSGSTLQYQLRDRRTSNPQILSEKLSESDEELDDLDDPAFMREWRRSRLRELQHGAGQRESKMHQRERSRRLWGGLTTVDGNGYLDAVEKSPSDTVVVVYIYDDYVSSQALER